MATREEVAAKEAEMQALQVQATAANLKVSVARTAYEEARRELKTLERQYRRSFGQVANMLYGPDSDPAIRAERELVRAAEDAAA